MVQNKNLKEVFVHISWGCLDYIGIYREKLVLSPNFNTVTTTTRLLWLHQKHNIPSKRSFKAHIMQSTSQTKAQGSKFLPSYIEVVSECIHAQWIT